MFKKVSSILVIMAILLQIFTGSLPVYSSVLTWQDSDVVASGFESGDGTEEHPFIISSAGQLAYFAKCLITGTDKFNFKYLVLTADINLAGRYWIPAGTEANSFQGHLNANGHVISNMNISANSGNPAFICQIAPGADVQRLGLESVSIDASGSADRVGGLTSYNYGTIRNCYVTGTLTSSADGWYAAGIAGANVAAGASGLIENCYSNVEITGYHGAGGIVGGNNGKVINCFALGTSSATYSSQYVGAVVGQLQHNGINGNLGSLSNCYYTDDSGITGCGNYSDEEDPEVDVSFYGTSEDFMTTDFFTNLSNWDIISPWDFTNTWTTDGDSRYPKLIPEVIHELNNGKLRFGNGAEDSINAKGGLQQPFYYNNMWYQLTYRNLALNYAIGVDGTNNGAWNSDGTIIEDSDLSGLDVDYSDLSHGAGIVEASGTLLVNGKLLEVKNKYILNEDSSFIKITTTITNLTETMINNVRYWTGTKDDYIATEDMNTKTKGVLTDGVFVANTSKEQRASVLKIESGTDAVLFFSTHPTTEMLIVDRIRFWLSMSPLITTDPRTTEYQIYSDNAYALFVNLGNIGAGESSSFDWYYAAGSAADIGNITNDIGNDAEEPGDAPAFDPSTGMILSENRKTVTLTFSEAIVNNTLDNTALKAAVTFAANGADYMSLGNDDTVEIVEGKLVISFANALVGSSNKIKVEANTLKSLSDVVKEDITETNAIDARVAPGMPTDVTALSGNGNAIVYFDAPADNGGSSILGYKVCVYMDGVPQDELLTIGESSPITVNGLTNGTAYTFRVIAMNAVGDSAESESSDEITPQVPEPGAPELYLPIVGNSQVSLSWSPAEEATGYTVFSSTISDSYGSELDTVSAAVYDYDATGLENGTTYYFRVRATNPGGSSYSNQVIAIPRTVPTAPTNVTANAGNRQALVSFIAPDDNGGSSITGYTIHVYMNGSLQEGLSTTGASSPITVAGLINGATYTFRVIAANAAGDSAESDASDQITPMTVPGAPTGVIAAAGNGQATISFTAPADNGGSIITSYRVISNPGNKTVTGTASPIKVTGLTNGTVYTFTVTATNDVGEGTSSAASNAVTPREPSSDRNDNNESKTTSTSQPPADTDVDILVNGKAESAGTATTTTKGNQTVMTITVDPVKLAQKLAVEGDNAIVTIPVNTMSDIVIGELNGQMVKNMETKQAVLEVRTGTASYTLPVQQINISAISEQLGTQVELKDIKVQIEITKASEQEVQLVANFAKKGEFTVIASPMEFKIKCVYGDKTIEVTSYKAYVERTMLIPESIDPSKITTGVIIDSNGTIRHVPTKVKVINGKYYAVINSLTNSLYSVVWHPVQFKDAERYWAKTEINDMGSRMIISGTGEDLFEPDRDITRAEFAAIIVRALGLKPEIGPNTFTDVKVSDWYGGYIRTAVDYDIISGYGNGKFGPMDKITREQAMTIVARAMNITGMKQELTASDAEVLLAKFKDVEKTAVYAKNSIALCIKTRIVSGKGGNLIAPKDNITRAEVAVIVRRLLQKSGLI